MAAYLITGISGTGKSTLQAVLVDKGYEAIDADLHAHWFQPATGQSFGSRPEGYNNVFDHFNWEWREDEINHALASKQTVFICGSAENQSKFYDKFSQIFLLTLTDDQIVHRLTHRTNNDFGKHPGDIETALQYRDRFETQLKSVGAIPIDANQKPNEIIKIIEKIISEDQ